MRTQPGPGERVAGNVRQLRTSRSLSHRELSRRLGELGRSILPSGIVKIEAGQRRVDADDLTALALALGVTPNRLLLTGDVGYDTVALTPAEQASQAGAWRWATGEQRLPGPFAASDQQFGAENRPHDPPDTTTVGELRQLEEDGRLDTLRRGFADAKAAGLSVRTMTELLRLWDLRAEVDEAERQHFGRSIPFLGSPEDETGGDDEPGADDETGGE